MQANQTTVAVLGLGLMGAGMAHNLIAAGFRVAVYNRNADKAARFAGSASIASSARAAAEGADIIISMVADDDAARAMWLGDLGALAGAKAGALCIESSTVTPDWIAAWSAQALAKGCIALDAPVTGSRVQAEAGELNFLVGGDAASVALAEPVFEAMGKSVTLLGPVGSGAMFKLINNFVCGVQLASLAEALTMIERSGLDRDKALETLMAGAVASPLVKLVSARMASGSYEPNFLVRLMAKDLSYASSAASKLGLELSTANTAGQAFAGASAAGFGGQDIAAVYRFVRGDTA